MAISRTRWRPDTCACDISYEYDSDTGTFTYHSTRKTCAAHAGLSGATLYAALKDQNKRKNLTRQAFLTELAADIGETQPDGSFEFKPGFRVDWSWSGTNTDRVLTVWIVRVDVWGNIIGSVPLNTGQRNKVQSRANALFGAGKVIITNV